MQKLRVFLLLLALLSILSFSCQQVADSTQPDVPSEETYVDWTWIGGSDSVNQPGVYGTKGEADINNIPGARAYSSSWTDNSGNFWLFGGYGQDSTGNMGWLNDLWKFNGTSWTWVAGGNVIDQTGVYGNKGEAAASNVPGSRMYSVSWTDASGNFWMFGGFGYGSTLTSNYGYLNDLWKFDGTNWTWVSGGDTLDSAGIYGNNPGEMNDATHVPGSRYASYTWLDASGNLWLFGGNGRDSEGTSGYLNDLWKFDGTYWIWISGSTLRDAAPSYGSKGTANPTNNPGARAFGASWIDSSDNLWLFGGARPATDGYNNGRLNDLWKFNGTDWTWVSGSNVAGQTGNYGTKNHSAVSNTPGASSSCVCWKDSKGNFWLLGGWAFDSQGEDRRSNELWKFNGVHWTWVAGHNLGESAGNYGSKEILSPDNLPGGHYSCATWKDASGNLWFFGGFGYGNTTTIDGALNDFWKISIKSAS